MKLLDKLNEKDFAIETLQSTASLYCESILRKGEYFMCEYCNSEQENRMKIIGDNTVMYLLEYRKGYWSIVCELTKEGDIVETIIHHCPMCGRKLTVMPTNDYTDKSWRNSPNEMTQYCVFHD